MKTLVQILTVVAFLISGNLVAQDSLQVHNQNKHQFKNQASLATPSSVKSFVDLDGDGFNDNAVDADGDGIPNGQDADYTGAKMRHGQGTGGFVDLDGDGINDNAPDADGDGIPNGQDADYVKPLDCTGLGSGFGSTSSATKSLSNVSTLGSGSGVCDGSGPKGKMNGRPN